MFVFVFLAPSHTSYPIHVYHPSSPSLGFCQYTSTGTSGMILVMMRAMETLKYSALCLPEDINERGLDKIPKFYYREDGLQVWGALNK